MSFTRAGEAKDAEGKDAEGKDAEGKDAEGKESKEDGKSEQATPPAPPKKKFSKLSLAVERVDFGLDKQVRRAPYSTQEGECYI